MAREESSLKWKENTRIRPSTSLRSGRTEARHDFSRPAHAEPFDKLRTGLPRERRSRSMNGAPPPQLN